jgi:serine/threonine-protein kinase RsbW
VPGAGMEVQRAPALGREPARPGHVRQRHPDRLPGLRRNRTGGTAVMPTPAPRALALRTTGVTYPGTADQIRVVRADLRALLDDCPMADDVLVCASELATNAVLHSHSRLAGGTFTVRGKVSPGNYFWLEVEDEGGPWTPTVADPERGHGLDIMRTLADDWGIEGDHDGRTVWARFDWPSP